jgi:mannobiose 2-epimerase
MRAELASKVLPYWFDTAQDLEHGGYRLADDAVRGRRHAREKQLVTQSRMIWGFAHAHRKGFSTDQRSYLGAAEQGHRFLRDRFLDRKHGGHFWKTDPSGKLLSDVKHLYAEGFVIYALVELHRAGRRPEPLQQAMDQYHLLERHAHDARHGGWLEHFTRDWQPITKPTPGAEIEVPGLKSANAHLHLMEAYAELYDATRDGDVKRSLGEAIEINTRHFFSEQAGGFASYRHADWRPATDPTGAGFFFGHLVEFAWLRIRAQQVLGEPPDWNLFSRLLDHALTHGYDHARGGLYFSGTGERLAMQTDKEWWVQAELLAALTDGLKHDARASYLDALEKLIRFVWTHQVDPRDGIWLDTVTADGQPKVTTKADSWKANYHDLRAMLKFIEAFGEK